MAADQKDLRPSLITNNLIANFDGKFLPSNLHVLQRLLYETRNKKSKVVNAIQTVRDEIIVIWKESSINVKRNDKCSKKLRNLYDSFTGILKLNGSTTKQAYNFFATINDVFDISQDNTIKMIGSIGELGKNSFLLKPIEYIKSKLSLFKLEKVTDQDDLVQDDEERLGKSSLKTNEPEIRLDSIIQSSPHDSMEPENEFPIGHRISPEELIEIENELSQKLSQTTVIDDNETNENADIESHIITRSKAKLLSTPQQSSSEETYYNSQGSGKPFTVSGRNYESKNDRGTINVMTPEVVAAFDKAKVSDRDAFFITALISHSLGHDVKSLIINRKSINTSRAVIRKQEYERMKKLIQDTDVAFLVVHWDGKLIPDNITCKRIDRLPILVTSDKFTKLINVPSLQDQKANTVATAVYAALKDWGLIDLITALCCDTTNVNLGSRGGAALILEQLMNKDLLYLACRRHICELLLRAGFEQKFPGTSGPDVPMFKRFREQWYTFDLNSFDTGLAELEPSLKDEVPRVIEKIHKFLREQQPRDDYKELFQLSLIFLGVTDEIKFKKPGAIHHARWMAKAIYTIKMFLFRKDFKLTQIDQAKLYAVCKFIVFIYLTPWYTASLSISAPNNDLKLIRSLINFEAIDENISYATLHKFRNHLWYLSPELTLLSLFDDDVDMNTKRKIVQSLKNQPLDDDTDFEGDSIKKFDPSSEGIKALGNKDLDYFTNSQSLNFLSRFKLDNSFLEIDCARWEENDSYLECREKLKHLVVVNDCAERAIHLTEEYVNTRSRDKEQNEYLLQFVDESRKNLLDSCEKGRLLKRMKAE